MRQSLPISFFGLSFLGLLLTIPAVAHEAMPCTDGMADLYPCSGVDLAHRLHLEALDIGGLRGTLEGADIWGWTSADGWELALVEGWNVDAISVTHALIPSSCSSSFDPMFTDGFESGETSGWGGG